MTTRPSMVNRDPGDADADRLGARSASSRPAPNIGDGSNEEPREPPEALGKRFLQPRTFVSFGLAAFIVFFIVRGLDVDMDNVWQQMRSANLPLLFAAFGTYYLAILVRAVRWRRMLVQVGIDERHGYRLPGIAGTFQILTLSLFANCVVPARLGDAYRSFLLKERSGASFGLGFGTILAERLIDVVVMVGVVVTAGAIVFGADVPGRAEQAFLLGLGVVIVGVLGALGLWFFRERIERAIPHRFTGHFQRLNKGIFDILRKPLPFAGFGVVIWLMDGLRVYLVAESLGANLTVPEAVVVSMLSALVTIVPFTPAGLGVVEGFMVWLLPQFGVPQDTAVAIALIDRSITYLSLLAIGLPLYLVNLRRDVKQPKAEIEPAPG